MVSATLSSSPPTNHKKRGRPKKLAANGEGVAKETADKRVRELIDGLDKVARVNLGMSEEQLMCRWFELNTGVLNRWHDEKEWARKMKEEHYDEGFAACLQYLTMDEERAQLVREEWLSVRGYGAVRHELRLADVLPSYDKQKKQTKKLDADVKKKLGVEPLSGLTGVKCDLKKLCDFIMCESMRMGYLEMRELVEMRITLDGADIGGRKAELIALVPTFREDCQSLHAVYPLCIYIGKETRQNIQDALPGLKEEMKDLRTRPQKYQATGARHCIRWTYSSDMFAMLKVLYTKTGVI